MGFPPQTPSPPQLYSQELQLKLYQAFIFSIPILFSIILFLLFYLFYLKKRTNPTGSSSSSTPFHESSIHDPFSPGLSVRTKKKKKNPLFSFQEIVLIGFLIIQFFLSSAEWFRFQRDDQRKASNNSIRWRCKNQRNSVRHHQTKNPRIINYLYFEIEFDKITYYFRCCVCLGEFKVNEELHLLPSCKHFFHMDCIRLWLHSNTTCPLCRCSVTTKNSSHSDEPLHHVSRPNDETVVQTTEVGIRMEQQEHPIMVGLSIDNNCTEQQQQQIVPHEQSSSSSSSGSRNSGVFENGINLLELESVVINIQTHDTWEGEQGLSIRPLFCFNPTKVSFFIFFFFLIRKQTLIRPFCFTETDWEFVYAFFTNEI